MKRLSTIAGPPSDAIWPRLLCALCALVAALAAGCSGADPPVLPPVPVVQTAALLPAVRDQIDQAIADVNADPRSVQRNSYLAMVLQTHKQLPAAETAYRRVRLLAPDEFRWVYLHAIVLAEVGHAEEAAKTFRRALALKSDDQLTMIRLAEVMVDLGRVPEARALFEAVAPAGSNLWEFHFGYGRFLLADGDPQAALHHFQNAMRLSGDFGAGHYHLGLAYRDLGERSQAERQFKLAEARRGLSADSNDPILNELFQVSRNDHAFLHRGKMLVDAGRFEEAREYFEMALERNPESVSAHASLMWMATQERDFETVQRHFDAAIALSPLHAKAWFNLGIARTAQQRWGEAIEAFERSRSLDDTDPDVHVQVAVLSRRVGASKTEVEASLRRALDLEPGHQLGTWMLGELLSDSGRLDEALELLERAVDQEHELRPMMFMALARARARLGQWGLAFAALDEAEASAGRDGDPALRPRIQQLRSELARERKQATSVAP